MRRGKQQKCYGEVTRNLREDDVVEWINCDSEAPAVCHMKDEQIVNMVLDSIHDKHEDSGGDSLSFVLKGLFFPS